MKIFITGINSELGYHLVERLRNDHLLLEGYSLISGTFSPQQSFALHESVHQSFDFKKQRDQAVKCAIDSDVLIVDIRNNPVPQIEFILKVLKHYKRNSEMKVIGVSNYMTWSNAKSLQFNKVPHDKEELLDITVNKQKWKEVSLQKQHYPLRSSHPTFVYNYLLEQQIMQLKHHQRLISPKILCTGVLYGKSGMDLRQQIKNAIECTNSQLIRLKQNNYIIGQQKLPFLNVQKLLQIVQNIVYARQNSQLYQKQQYSVLCENQSKYIFEIVENLHQTCGHVQFLNQMKEKAQKNLQNNNVFQNQQKYFIPELSFANNKKLFSLLFNLNFSTQSGQKPIRQQDKIAVQINQIEKFSQNKQKKTINGILQFVKQIINEFKEYHQVSYKHFILPQQLVQQILSDQSQTQLQNQNRLKHQQRNTIKSLLKKYSLLDKNKMTLIKDQLIQSGRIPQQRLITPQQQKKKSKIIVQKNQKKQTIKKQPEQLFFPQIIKTFLTQKKDSNFIICIQNQLIIKMLNLLQQEKSAFLRDIRFILLNKGQDNLSNQSVQILSQNIDKSIQLFSDEFFKATGLSLLKCQFQDQNEEFQLAQDFSQKQKVGHKTDNSAFNQPAESEQTKFNLLSQYLLDNFIVYLAQAKQKLKQKGIMKDGQKFEGKQNLQLFINQLKQIKKRQEKSEENQDEEEKES